MINSLSIKPTNETPKVVLDAQNNIFELTGRSLPEDANKFFSPIKEWMVEYVKSPNPSTEIVFNLDYFNSSSARLIVKILIELEQLIEKGFKVNIIWKYKANDEVMYDRGEEIQTVLKLPFEFVILG